MSLRPVALVTGAARRLGREIALDLAAHGWDVAVHYLTSREEAKGAVAAARAIGAGADCFAADLSAEDACASLVRAVSGHFGRIDAVVNSASLFEYDDVDSFCDQTLRRHLSVNVTAAIVLARALHAAVGPEGRGCVVNLLDQKLWNPNPDHLSYTLSKATLRTASILLAQALAPKVRVCSVAPGLTLGSPLIDEERLAELQSRSLLGRGTTARDVASAVRFLLTNDSVTGAEILVDAGDHLRPQPRDYAFQ